MRYFWVLVALILVGCSKVEETPTVNQPVDNSKPEAVAPAPVELPPLVEPTKTAANGVELRLKLVQGAKENREVTGSIKIELDKKRVKPGQPSVIDSILAIDYTTEVLSSSAGKMKVRIVSKPIQATTSSGSSSSQAEDFSVVFDELGNPLDNYEGLVKSALSAGFIRFPKSKLVEGSSWSLSSERDVPILGNVKYTESYTFRGKANRNGVEVWHVEIAAKGSDKLTTKGDYYLDMKTGSLAEAVIYQTILAEIPQENGNVPAKISMTARLRPKSNSI